MQLLKESIGKSALSIDYSDSLYQNVTFWNVFREFPQNRTFWEWCLYISIEFYLFIYY